MSDLSQLLDGLYADETPPRAPAWSSEEALDEAFSSWVPGPPADAPSAERSILSEAIESLPVEPAEREAHVSDWLMDTEPLAPATTAEAARDALVDDEPVESVAAPSTRWMASDDDILPSRGPRSSATAKSRKARERRRSLSFSFKK